MNARFFIAAPIAFAVSLAFIGAAASPAMAAPATCTIAPAQIRAAAATANPDAARKALLMVATAEKMCEQGGTFDAGKKFAAAAKVLGTDLASLPAPTAQ